MSRRLWLSPLTLCSLVVISCGQETAPTEATGAADKPSPVASSAVAGGTWTTKAPMPTGRGYLAAAVQNNSLGQPVLYAIGGYSPDAGRYVRTVEAYNFATNSWSTKVSLPLALAHTNGVGVIGGKLYLSGGYFQTAGGTGYHPGLNVYDPARNSWTKKAEMPRRFAQGVTGVINGKLYVLTGGCNNCGPERFTRRLYRYDPVTDSWAALPWSPNFHVMGAGAVINGKFYVAGGHDQDFQSSNKLDVYDPATNKWKTLAPMPTARMGVAGAALENKLYILGRSDVDPGEPQNQVEAYDPVTNTWSARTSMPGAGRGDLAAGSLTFGGRSHMLAVGGFDVEGSGPGHLNQAYTP